MNLTGNSAVLLDLQAHICEASSMKVFGVAISSALTGTLTINGMSTAGGAAQPWVIAPGTFGYVAAPGSGLAWKLLSYVLSNAGDSGKAFIAWSNV